MSLLGGRGGRSDDWATPHLRAQARASERLDGPLDPTEEAWLDDHLAECAACSAAAADYASQRLELRSLRDRPPLPPRDLWARTAAAIEREAGPRRGRRSTRSVLAPYALLVGALIVAVAVGSLSLSRFNPPTATPGNTPIVAQTPGQPSAPAATPILVPGTVAYLSHQADGRLQLKHFEFTQVCAPAIVGCETTGPTDSQTIGPLASPDSVFGATAGGPLVVVSNGDGSGGKVYAVALASQLPEVTPTPTASSLTSTSPSEAPATPTGTPTSAPSEPIPPSAEPSESAGPTPSLEPSPSESPEAVVEIAHDLVVLDSTAAYAPDGSAFAFTARPADGSFGPDIYVWHVGDPQAVAVTTDHRSVFGSWANGSIVGSTVTAGPDGIFDRPLAFVLSPGAMEPTVVPSESTSPEPTLFSPEPSLLSPEPSLPPAATTFLPQTGRAWRPVVDPTGRTAVYWSGSVQPTADGLGWTTVEGQLVVGRWDDTMPIAEPSADPNASASPTPTPTPTPTPLPTATPITSADPSAEASAMASADAEQPLARSETTIAAGPLTDWVARWDETGTHLAIWIADPIDPTVGRLSLFVIDPFDGRIDQSAPPLLNEPALAGFAIVDGHLAWTAPPTNGSTESTVRVLAWTGVDFGKIESAPGDVILVR